MTSVGDKKPNTGTAGGGPTIPRKASGKLSIFSLDAPTALTMTQGEPSADGCVHPLDSARIASLALHHFSAEHAALIKANLHVKSLGTEALTALNSLINDDELQQAGIAALLEPIAEHITSVLSLTESCMANISRSAVLTNLKIDPEHIKLMDMLEINNQLNPHRQPLSLAKIRELLGLAALTNKIAAKDTKASDDAKG